MLGFDRAMADPELLDVVAESERHAEDGDASSIGALVSSWLGLTSSEPAVLQLEDEAAGDDSTATQPRRHELSDITELPEIPEQPEETSTEVEEDGTPTGVSEKVAAATAAESTEAKPTTPGGSTTATSPTFRERLASLFSRLQSPSAGSPSVIELPTGERPRSSSGPAAADRRASATSRLSLDESDAAIPPPSYTLGRPDPILLNPGLLPLVESPQLSQPSPERLERRRRSGVTAAPVHGALELQQLKHSAEPSAEQLEGGPADGSGMPAIRHKSVEYVGMFEYKKEDEELLIRSLIFDLRPKTAAVLLPGLPAYILFMCIRHTDLVNDDEKVRRLLTAAINGVKRVVKKRRDDVETLIMWLANVCRLLHNLKQYSGDKAFQSENTEKQNEQCLKSFDLSEYRQVLSDVAMWIYQLVIKQLEERVQPVVVPAVLEHEAIAGLTGRPAGIRGRAGSSARQLESPVSSEAALDALHSSLKKIHRTLGELGVDPEITAQIFKQLFYAICAHSLNNLLLRKELCHWTKGMQIRYNLSHLEQWCRDNRLHDPETGVMDTLQPIIQASQLLQARKTEEDVARVCDMCDKLTTPQIIKILNLYTPDEYEERVPISFIRKVQEHLQQHRDPETDGSARLLMDSKFAFPVRFPFNPSNIRLEDIEIPDILKLPMLKKL
ncbi:Unconventional myosin-Va [Amphibalanus amphitrite]|uniref:Unconventional myosin-Va n=1 Tax=Amphibalanus amphitrite TaxID=1232801 RepID=A0A6A4VJG7_AMPAM|nr:Unconventional myosin-Va [Amphibalanus amphitrite]